MKTRWVPVSAELEAQIVGPAWFLYFLPFFDRHARFGPLVKVLSRLTGTVILWRAIQ